MKMTGAEALLHALQREQVDLIFGYPGGAIMPTYDALYAHPKLRHVLVRHEQGAVHAAEGYARATGKVGVCLATSGPGATNLITGIADAFMDSVPLVCITGQVASGFLGTDAFQEADILSMSLPITKWNYQVTKAEEIPQIIAEAFRIAQSDRPGPVLIDITKDAQVSFMEMTPKMVERTTRENPIADIDDVAISHAADLINRAKRPFILFGHGILMAMTK